MAPAVGLEPTTNRLTADCSTTELHRNNEGTYNTKKMSLQVFFFKKRIFFFSLTKELFVDRFGLVY